MVNDETGHKIESYLQHTLERGFPHDILYLMLPCLPREGCILLLQQFHSPIKQSECLLFSLQIFAAKNFVFWKRNRKWS